MDYMATFERQLKLLLDWNEKNIDKEPEQVRRNIETMMNYVKMSSYNSVLG